MTPRPRRRWRRRLLWFAALVVLPPLAAHQHVLWMPGGRVCSVADAPACEVAIVLGARIHPDGRPSHMLEDRLEAAAELLRLGKVQRLLLSGDARSSEHYDEPAVMRRYLLARGVPAAAMQMDPWGMRTLDTMVRAHDTFGLTRALVVSNGFHVPRAVFLGAAHGLDVTGVIAPGRRTYSHETMWRNQAREVAARVWAWVDVFVLDTPAVVARD